MNWLKNATVISVLLLIALLWGGYAMGLVGLGGGINFLLGLVIGVGLLVMPYRIIRSRLSTGYLRAPLYVLVLLVINLALNWPVVPAVGLLTHFVFYTAAFVANWLPDQIFNRPLETRH